MAIGLASQAGSAHATAVTATKRGTAVRVVVVVTPPANVRSS